VSDIFQSEPALVTFFEDRAEVQRKARVRAAPGASAVRIEGVTPLVHDPSVQVKSPDAKLRVLAVRVERRIDHLPGPGAGEVAAIEEERDAARRRRQMAERVLQRSHADQSRAQYLEQAWSQALRRVPDRASDELPALRAALEQIDGELVRGLDGAESAAAEVTRAQLDEARAEARLQLARTAQPRAVTLVEVQLQNDSGAAIEAALSLSYQTPCALWRPEHLARLSRADDGKDRIELTTFATAWQRTGEKWADVACRFSTARPARPASPPLLTDDVLVSRRKTPEERSKVVVEAREQQINLAGLGRGARAVDEMPGVEDGGEPLWLSALRPASIASDGQPVRIEVGKLELACSAERVAFPELSPMVHVRATATLAGKSPLLAGPVLLVRRTEAVGRSRTRFVGAGEPFELGFGVDDGLRVRRQQSEERETTPVVGTQKITRTVELYLSNLSGEARALTLGERIPVSEIDGLTIKLIDWQGEGPDKDGFVRARVELPAGATEKRTLRYRIEAPARIQLPGAGGT
jgi:uncharacterized protein (TIGR02231 family)